MDDTRLARLLAANFYMTRELVFKHGLGREDIVNKMRRQEGMCECCGVNLDGKKWVVDHSHKNGKARGLICFSCNLAVRDVERVRHIVKYLHKYGEVI